MKTIYDEFGIKLIQGDCMKVIPLLTEGVDIVCTSPPYNSGKALTSDEDRERYDGRYDVYIEDKTQAEYCNWTVELFNSLDKILKPNGVILYNMSYGTNCTSANNAQIGLMWLCIADLIRQSPFTVADCIVWKKKSALPNNSSSNKLTRICEFVYVLCRKTEYTTFKSNKKIKGESGTGQLFYENMFNFILADNNDGAVNLNKTTYSTSLCTQLLSMYGTKGCLVLDPFSGTGTTGNACKQLGMNYIGIELSEAQCEYAKDRLEPKGLYRKILERKCRGAI